MSEVGTLKELGVEAGDVVESIAWARGCEFNEYEMKLYKSVPWVVHDVHPNGFCGKCAVFYDGYTRYDESMIFRIISRANQNQKLWRDMTPEEKGAMLLASHEGKVIELWLRGEWVSVDPSWHDSIAYRVQPEPKIDTVTLTGFHETARGHRITFNTINSKPDCASIKMEAI